MSERLHWTAQKGRGVCREQKEDWCAVPCGWRAFVKKTNDFSSAIRTGPLPYLVIRQLARAATLSPTLTLGRENSKRHRQ